MLRFDGKVVIVTGAASGIGAAAASRFAAEGAAVVLADVADEPGRSLASALTADGARARYAHCDVGDEHAWERLRAETHEAFGPVDVVHSNAFVVVNAPAHELATADWDRQIAVNLRALYLRPAPSSRTCSSGRARSLPPRASTPSPGYPVTPPTRRRRVESAPSCDSLRWSTAHRSG